MSSTAVGGAQQNGGSLDDREAAIKKRIITHMNADHAESLRYYLRHYCGVLASDVDTAKLTDINVDHMIIESRAGRNLIPFAPSMKSLSESRERVIVMHHEAMKGLGLSDIKVTRFAGPQYFWQWFTLAITFWSFTTLPFRNQMLPESRSFIYQGWSLGGTVPQLARLTYLLAPYTLAFMIVVHSMEAFHMATGRLRKHQVSVGSSTWWLWVVNTFISGVATFTRFDEMIAEIEAKKKDQKH